MTNNDFGSEFWLHVIGDSTSKYAKDGGNVAIQETASGVVITLLDVTFDNPALPQKFVDLSSETAVNKTASKVAQS